MRAEKERRRDLMSRGAKRTAIRIILALLGVFVGWAAASYAYVYFAGNGVTSTLATEYSIILWLVVLGAFGLIAFKVNLQE
jgi:hypothetical protein